MRDKDERIAELLRSNNQLLERARNAEARVRSALDLAQRHMDEKHAMHRAVPDEFCLDPPDGGDVKPVEAVQRMAAENERLKQQVAALESLRPHWAQGFTDDSVAAQASTAALVQIWARLGAVDQTDAMRKIEELKA